LRHKPSMRRRALRVCHRTTRGRASWHRAARLGCTGSGAWGGQTAALGSVHRRGTMAARRAPVPPAVGAVVAEKGDRRSGLVGSRKAAGRQVGGDPAMGSYGDSRWAAAGERRWRMEAIGHRNTELGRGGGNLSRSRRITARQIS
jgi:hypothetical protein